MKSEAARNRNNGDQHVDSNGEILSTNLDDGRLRELEEQLVKQREEFGATEASSKEQISMWQEKTKLKQTASQKLEESKEKEIAELKRIHHETLKQKVNFTVVHLSNRMTHLQYLRAHSNKRL